MWSTSFGHGVRIVPERRSDEAENEQNNLLVFRVFLVAFSGFPLTFRLWFPVKWRNAVVFGAITSPPDRWPIQGNVLKKNSSSRNSVDKVKAGDPGLGRRFAYFIPDEALAYSKVGTPLYMSPEVLKGVGYSWKSDIWSLGSILYELAMLRSPFDFRGLNLLYGLVLKISRVRGTTTEKLLIL